jgi:hypothetical protein
MRRWLIGLMIAGCVMLGVVGVAAQNETLRGRIRAIVRPEAPPPITPIAVTLPTRSPTPLPPTPTLPPTATPPVAEATRAAAATPAPSPTPAPTLTPVPTPTAGPVEVSGRVYDAYIPAASKPQQFYQYSCEFDAAWVIFETFGRSVGVDEMVAVIGVDGRVEPYIEETADGFIIHGGDIASAFSGDYTANFLARSTGQAMIKVFEHWDLPATPVRDRAGVEAALRSGQLVWMKTTVDFKPWRPATWLTPEGQRFQTVLGNDHAVVAIGFNADVVVIRDVLGPTSSNWQRPYEYEVSWDTFLGAWGAQNFDGLAVGPPAS